MKKVLRSLLLVIMALCFSLPCFGTVEAATVALLPLVNNTENDMANQVFFKNALNALKAQKGFILVENDKLNAAIESATVSEGLATAPELEAIAKNGEVDIVIGFALNKLDTRVRRSAEENKVILDLEGNVVAYNSLTGEHYSRKIKSTRQTPEALTSRYDFKQEEWGREVRKEIKKALSGK